MQLACCNGEDLCDSQLCQVIATGCYNRLFSDHYAGLILICIQYLQTSQLFNKQSKLVQAMIIYLFINTFSHIMQTVITLG